MTSIFNDDFLLETEFARSLYRATSALPIIDYHSHLPIKVIAENKPFENLTDIWIRGDHYKWRAMRLNGIPEHFCSGDASDLEKFQVWAQTLPLTIRSPLYHWSALELQRYFNINESLTPDTASVIWSQANALLHTESYRPRALLKMMNVEVLCTTDDPADSLEYHKQLSEEEFEVKVLPTFRPDLALAIDNRPMFSAWLQRLAERVGSDIDNFNSFITALRVRHDAFANVGCRMSDHGLERCYVAKCNEADMHRIFNNYLSGKVVDPSDVECWCSFLMREFAKWDHEKGWTMLLHLGAARNNNVGILNSVGRDAGCDSVGDFDHAYSLNAFLSVLDGEGSLPKTVLFNSNPRDNLLFATITGNFFESGVVGKVQYGPAWWFLDTAGGISEQLNALSQVGLFSHFIGMVTDSRSFLSFIRHDYFRRVVCNMLGEDVRRGLIPSDVTLFESVLHNIFYKNARAYIGE